MEISQANSLCGYLHLKQAKMFFFLSFLYYRLQNWSTGGWNKSFPEGKGWHQWEGGGGGERG
jgi:hypothetical protein